jgi:hypothetical protein
LVGGLGITGTGNASSTTNGGGMTVAGGGAVAKSLHIGSTLTISTTFLHYPATLAYSRTASLSANSGFAQPILIFDTLEYNSGGTGLTYNAGTGIFTYSGPTRMVSVSLRHGMASISGVTINAAMYLVKWTGNPSGWVGLNVVTPSAVTGLNCVGQGNSTFTMEQGFNYDVRYFQYSSNATSKTWLTGDNRPMLIFTFI